MNVFNFNGGENLKPSSQIWEERKNEYNKYFYILVGFLVALLAIFITAVVLNYLIYMQINQQEVALSIASEKRHWPINNALITIVVTAILIAYSSFNLVKAFLNHKESMAKKEFSSLRFAQSVQFTIGFGLIINMFFFLQNRDIQSLITNNFGERYDILKIVSIPTILVLVFYLITIFVIIMAIWPMKNLRIISFEYFNSRRQEELKKMSEAFKNSNMGNGFNPFAPGFNPTGADFQQNQNDTTSPGDGDLEVGKRDSEVKNEKEDMLRDLSLSELKKIAKKMNIFGYEDMTREELIRVIANFSE
ncbi:hypothetical protein ACW95P_00910 [Candidatus Mycoplasma pogonae]